MVQYRIPYYTHSALFRSGTEGFQFIFTPPFRAQRLAAVLSIEFSEVPEIVYPVAIVVN